jgi:hypothetical protein
MMDIVDGTLLSSFEKPLFFRQFANGVSFFLKVTLALACP